MQGTSLSNRNNNVLGAGGAGDFSHRTKNLVHNYIRGVDFNTTSSGVVGGAQAKVQGPQKPVGSQYNSSRN